MTRALVIAAHSFVGKHLCARLEALGAQVTASHRWIDDGLAAAACDITDAEHVNRLISYCRPAWVFQCAGATATADPHEMFRVHVGGTLNVLDAVRRHVPEAHVVLLGSAAEYGSVAPEALPIRETQCCLPTSFFGASKHAQTEIAGVAAMEWGLRVSIARPFNIIGPGLPPYYFAASLARRLIEANSETGNARPGPQSPFPVTNADATRDFVDVRDVADALIAMVQLEHSAPGQAEVFNVATGSEVTIRSAATKLAELAGGHWDVVAGNTAKSRSNISRSCGDPSKLRERTGWQAKIPWERSLEDLWGSLRGAQTKTKQAESH